MPHLGLCLIPRDSGVRDPDQHLDPSCGWRLVSLPRQALVSNLDSEIEPSWSFIVIPPFREAQYTGSKRLSSTGWHKTGSEHWRTRQSLLCSWRGHLVDADVVFPESSQIGILNLPE